MPEFKTVAYLMNNFVNKDFPLEPGYKIFKAIAEDKTIQAAAYPPMQGVNIIENTIKYVNTPLHIGTIKYLKEKGYKVPDRQIPPEAK
jgi:TRAP-type uncharacterized transport system substrate-binding protein